MPLSVGVAFLNLSPVMGEGVRVAAVWMCWANTQQIICVIKRFNGLSGCGWYNLPLAPVSRLNALYLRFNGLLSVVWYLISYTTTKAVMAQIL